MQRSSDDVRKALRDFQAWQRLLEVEVEVRRYDYGVDPSDANKARLYEALSHARELDEALTQYLATLDLRRAAMMAE